MHCNSIPITQISKKFKVSRPTIYNIIEMERINQPKIDFYTHTEDLNKEMSIQQTNFLGITIDTENGSSNPKINKALNKSLDLLDIMQFIKVLQCLTIFGKLWWEIGVPWWVHRF